MSQHDVALAAGISTRHMSFVETGRSQPSRETVGLLAGALGIPPRERNLLFKVAGYAPICSDTPMDAPAMGVVQTALRLMLRRQEPFGAVVLDRQWDVVMVNTAMQRFLVAAGQSPPVAYELARPGCNWLKVLLGPGPIRKLVVNWSDMAEAVLARLQRELWSDPEREPLLSELKAFPGMPTPSLRLASEPVLLIPVCLRLGKQEVRLFSTVSSLGTAQDLTLQELKIDCFHPFDAESFSAVG
jgi:transcriptional regulator with XRE-family HTH domain